MKKGASFGNGRVNPTRSGTRFAKTSLPGPRRPGSAGTVENANGAVRPDIKGALVSAPLSLLWLDGAEGPVDVDNQNGSMEVKRAGGGAKAAATSAEDPFAPIRFTLPENGFMVTARTSFERSDRAADHPTGTLSDESLHGKIGDGRCELTLTDNNTLDRLQRKVAKSRDRRRDTPFLRGSG